MAASYISVPRDLTKVKSKVMFNLTKRQLICFSVAALIGVPSFFLIKQIASTSTAAIGMMVIMMPFFFLAMYEKNGQHLEVILGHLIEATFIRPKQRPYYKESGIYAKEQAEVQTVPIQCKVALTIKEAAEYSNIGINKLECLLRSPRCPFVLYVGKKKLVKRKEFEKFISDNIEI